MTIICVTTPGFYLNISGTNSHIRSIHTYLTDRLTIIWVTTPGFYLIISGTNSPISIYPYRSINNSTVNITVIHCPNLKFLTFKPIKLNCTVCVGECVCHTLFSKTSTVTHFLSKKGLMIFIVYIFNFIDFELKLR